MNMIFYFVEYCFLKLDCFRNGLKCMFNIPIFMVKGE